MFQIIVTIDPDKDGIHCGSCAYLRGDGFHGFCWQFNHAEMERDPSWRTIKRCAECLKAEKQSRDKR